MRPDTTGPESTHSPTPEASPLEQWILEVRSLGARARLAHEAALDLASATEDLEAKMHAFLARVEGAAPALGQPIDLGGAGVDLVKTWGATDVAATAAQEQVAALTTVLELVGFRASVVPL